MKKYLFLFAFFVVIATSLTARDRKTEVMIPGRDSEGLNYVLDGRDSAKLKRVNADSTAGKDPWNYLI
ncbi:MAG TPA: hypothetical protein VMT63_07810 [Bacteroidales bacterium]|nr:hypothetical protein [Bacteroidales bacterium]